MWLFCLIWILTVFNPAFLCKRAHSMNVSVNHITVGWTISHGTQSPNHFFLHHNRISSFKFHASLTAIQIQNVIHVFQHALQYPREFLLTYNNQHLVSLPRWQISQSETAGWVTSLPRYRCDYVCSCICYSRHCKKRGGDILHSS